MKNQTPEPVGDRHDEDDVRADAASAEAAAGQAEPDFHRIVIPRSCPAGAWTNTSTDDSANTRA